VEMSDMSFKSTENALDSGSDVQSKEQRVYQLGSRLIATVKTYLKKARNMSCVIFGLLIVLNLILGYAITSLFYFASGAFVIFLVAVLYLLDYASVMLKTAEVVFTGSHAALTATAGDAMDQFYPKVRQLLNTLRDTLFSIFAQFIFIVPTILTGLSIFAFVINDFLEKPSMLSKVLGTIFLMIGTPLLLFAGLLYFYVKKQVNSLIEKCVSNLKKGT